MLKKWKVPSNIPSIASPTHQCHGSNNAKLYTTIRYIYIFSLMDLFNNMAARQQLKVHRNLQRNKTTTKPTKKKQ